MHSDQSVAESGKQNLSFAFAPSGSLKARIDRKYRYNDYWISASPSLNPDIDFSVVLEDGSDGYACFVKGQNLFFSDDPNKALGFADPYLTDYLIHQTHQYALPWLMKRLSAGKTSLVVGEAHESRSGLSFPTLEDTELGLTVLINSTSGLPYIIRSVEMHATFGKSTSDLILSNWTEVPVPGFNGILLPHRLQTLYNSAHVLKDLIIDEIKINPTFSSGFFQPNGTSESQTPRSKPARNPEYPRSEVHEFFDAGLWAGPFQFNTSDVVGIQPVAGLDKVQAVYIGYADYIQLVVEFEDGVLVADAPAHRSKILLQWISETMNKNVKYVVPSHHHRDHAGGVGDYVAAGAKLVIPEVAKEFYSYVNAGDIQVITFNETAPFVLKDKNVQFRSMWHDEAPHARDWTYAVASKACPSDGLSWDTGYARQWLIDAQNDGLPNSAIVVGAHGASENGTSTVDELRTLIDITAYPYPDLTPKDWKAGGPLC